MFRNETCRYFESYANHFGVRKTIRFNTTVLNASLLEGDEDRKWKITYRTNDENICSDVFDFLMVANGHHWYCVSFTEPENYFFFA